MDPALFWCIAFAGGLIGLTVIGYFFLWWRDINRARALARVATTLGFSFDPTPVCLSEMGERAVIALENFHLFLQGTVGYESGKLVSKCMQGKLGEIEVLLFDYAYTEKGHYDTLPRPTVAAFHLKGMKLPSFELRPKHGLAIPHFPLDSKREVGVWEAYVLSQGDKAAMEPLLDADVCRLLRVQKGWYVEGWVDRLIVYRRKVKPEEVRQFLEAGAQLCRLLAKENRDGSYF